MPNIENEECKVRYIIPMENFEFTDTKISDETFCSELDEEYAKLVDVEEIYQKDFTSSNSKFVGCTFLVDDLWDIELINCEFVDCTFRSQDPAYYFKNVNDWTVLHCKFFGCEFSNFEKVFGVVDDCTFIVSKVENVTLDKMYLGMEECYRCKFDELVCNRVIVRNLFFCDYQMEFEPKDGIHLSKSVVDNLALACDDLDSDTLFERVRKIYENSEVGTLQINGEEYHPKDVL